MKFKDIYFLHTASLRLTVSTRLPIRKNSILHIATLLLRNYIYMSIYVIVVPIQLTEIYLVIYITD